MLIPYYTSAPGNYKRVCYFVNWATYRDAPGKELFQRYNSHSRLSSSSLSYHLSTSASQFPTFVTTRPPNPPPPVGKFVPEDLDATLCTHVIYAFSVLDEKTHTLKIFDEDVDIKQSEL